jgi:hypothetical protein
MRWFGWSATLALVLACSGPGPSVQIHVDRDAPVEGTLGAPERLVAAAIGGDAESAWGALDPRCQATIDRPAFDGVIHQFAQVASQRSTRAFASLAREPSESGMIRNAYHFADDRASPRPRILIVVPTVEETGLPCGLSWDHAAATTIRELHETPLIEEKASWAISGGRTIDIFEVVARPVAEQRALLVIKAEPLTVLEAPNERAPELALSIARAAYERGWMERAAAHAKEHGREPSEVVGIRFVDPDTFDSYTELVAWSAVSSAR